MRKVWLFAFLCLFYSQSGFALSGPSLKRVDPSLSMLACRQAQFAEEDGITEAIRSGLPSEALRALGPALRQLHDTPVTSDLYASRAFCLHELVPSGIDVEVGAPASSPTSEVKAFRSLGIEYFYYEPDRRWTLKEDPVSLEELASAHLNSRWGRQAFLMMTQLGWSDGGCREGPDQFRRVIDRGKRFLGEYPRSEVSNDVRLAMANAYATWWNLSRNPGEPHSQAGPNAYRQGAEAAKSAAIDLYRQYLRSRKMPDPPVKMRLRRLLDDPKGTGTYEYYCPDYED